MKGGTTSDKQEVRTCRWRCDDDIFNVVMTSSPGDDVIFESWCYLCVVMSSSWDDVIDLALTRVLERMSRFVRVCIVCIRWKLLRRGTFDAKQVFGDECIATVLDIWVYPVLCIGSRSELDSEDFIRSSMLSKTKFLWVGAGFSHVIVIVTHMMLFISGRVILFLRYVIYR